MLRRADSAAALIAFGLSALFGLHRLRFGLNQEDEAFYLATSLRYALGDIPFRDEIFNPARMYDLLLTPLFVLAPDLGVLELRIGWLCVQLGATFALFLLLRRFAPDSVVALACCSVVFLPNIIWTPAYHLMSAFFFVLAWALWLAACLAAERSRALLQGVAAGLVYSLGAAAYLPLLATGIVPALVLAHAAWQRAWGAPKTWATLAFLATLGGVALIGIGLLFQAGLEADWLAAQSRITSVDVYARSLQHKLVILLWQLGWAWSVGLSTFSLVLALAALQRAFGARASRTRAGAALVGIGTGVAVLVSTIAIPTCLGLADGLPGRLLRDGAIPLCLVAMAITLLATSSLLDWLARRSPRASHRGIRAGHSWPRRSPRAA